jgi:ribosomal protein S2
VEASEHHPIDVMKPGRFGHGEHMTVAIYPDDYRTTDEAEVIDIQSTVERLKQAESLVEEVSSME